MSRSKDKVTVSKDVELPTFVVRFWDISKKKLAKRGYDVSSKGLSKRFAKHFFSGTIQHVQSKKSTKFDSVSQLHAFIEKYRV